MNLNDVKILKESSYFATSKVSEIDNTNEIIRLERIARGFHNDVNEVFGDIFSEMSNFSEYEQNRLARAMTEILKGYHFKIQKSIQSHTIDLYETTKEYKSGDDVFIRNAINIEIIAGLKQGKTIVFIPREEKSVFDKYINSLAPILLQDIKS